MLWEFEKKVADFVQAHGLFDSGDTVLLAVSGGADSTALMHTMAALKAAGAFDGKLLCAHINHQLRGRNAQADEDFVCSEASNLGLEVATRRVDVRAYAGGHKLSIETAGRDLRIETLAELARADNCNCIATAHHKNDNAETLLQRMLRGTGYRGLAGIWPRRRLGGIEFARPLLGVRRDEIIEYLERRNLTWRQDHTNYDCSYRRNFIRHRLIPALQPGCHGSIVEQLSELAQSSRKFYSLICSFADTVWPQMADAQGDKVVLDLNSFGAQPLAVQVELARRSLVELGSGERDLTQSHYERILQLATEKTSGRRTALPNGFFVFREYGNLVFGWQDMPGAKSPNSRSIKARIPGQTRFGDYLIETAVFDAQINAGRFKAGKTSFVEWFDLEKLRMPLEVRFRRVGERFVPLGLAKEKKVGKFLTAQRVPERIRRRTLVVADSEKVIWVWPIRMSEQAKITADTRKILRLQITDASTAETTQKAKQNREQNNECELQGTS